MRSLARDGAALPEIRGIASLVGSPDGLEDFIRGHFFYRGEHEEVVRSVDWMLKDLATQGFVEGDCDDISTFLGAALLALHIPARFVAIKYGGSPEFLHVFIEWRDLWGDWRSIDPTVGAGTIHQEDERLEVYV